MMWFGGTIGYTIDLTQLSYQVVTGGATEVADALLPVAFGPNLSHRAHDRAKAGGRWTASRWRAEWLHHPSTTAAHPDPAKVTTKDRRYRLLRSPWGAGTGAKSFMVALQ